MNVTGLALYVYTLSALSWSLYSSALASIL